MPGGLRPQAEKKHDGLGWALEQLQLLKSSLNYNCPAQRHQQVYTLGWPDSATGRKVHAPWDDRALIWDQGDQLERKTTQHTRVNLHFMPCPLPLCLLCMLIAYKTASLSHFFLWYLRITYNIPLSSSSAQHYFFLLGWWTRDGKEVLSIVEVLEGIVWGFARGGNLDLQLSLSSGWTWQRIWQVFTLVSVKPSASSGTHSGKDGGQVSSSGYISSKALLFHRPKSSQPRAFAKKQGRP